MKPNKPLAEYSTRTLLAMRDYRYNYDTEVCGEDRDPAREQEQIALMAELNKREHVPNKVEAKALRQARAKDRVRRKK